MLTPPHARTRRSLSMVSMVVSFWLAGRGEVLVERALVGTEAGLVETLLAHAARQRRLVLVAVVGRRTPLLGHRSQLLLPGPTAHDGKGRKVDGFDCVRHASRTQQLRDQAS